MRSSISSKDPNSKAKKSGINSKKLSKQANPDHVKIAMYSVDSIDVEGEKYAQINGRDVSPPVRDSQQKRGPSKEDK